MLRNFRRENDWTVAANCEMKNDGCHCHARRNYTWLDKRLSLSLVLQTQRVNVVDVT